MTAGTADILRKAKALIDTPEKWTKGAFARTVEGASTSSYAPDASCFCLWGAITSAGRVIDCGTWKARKALYAVIGADDLMEWNDAPERTHAEVMAAFEKAIELAEAQS